MSAQLWFLDQKRRSVGSEATKLKHDKALISHRYLVIATYSARKRRANHVTKTSNYFDHRIVRAGTSTVRDTFAQIFFREKVKAAFIEGDAFHRFDRAEMKKRMAEAQGNPANHFSHFGEEANEFALLEDVFKTYGETGNGRTRTYVHDDEEAEQWGCSPGTFTDWRSFEDDTDLLFYEGLHGAVATDKVDIAQYADLKVGVVPVMNLEWIQKLHRDKSKRGYSTEAVTDTILRRMHDYVHYICPQFALTNINFQRVPIVDTSNPFIARWIPTPDESMVVIRFANPRGIDSPTCYP